LLYAKSGNRCAFPNCPNPITHDQTLVGEVAHIKGASPKGPRYDPAQTDEERRSYENVLLLCSIHNKVVDDDEEAYTVERLKAMKAAHEAQATSPTEDEIDSAVGLLTGKTVVQSVSHGIINNAPNYGNQKVEDNRQYGVPKPPPTS
jgi:hypothetical protein